MTLTSPNCPVAESLPNSVKENILKIDGIEDVNLKLVWDPPWTKDKMSEAAKLGIEFMSEQIIKLSDNAAERIKLIMSKAEGSAIGVRVGVKSGGCAGMSYVMEYAKEVKPNEEIVEEKGVKVLIDPNAVIYLLGTEMDFKQEKFSSQFIFRIRTKLNVAVAADLLRIKLTTIIHLKFYRMRCMFKIINFLEFQFDISIDLVVCENTTLS